MCSEITGIIYYTCISTYFPCTGWGHSASYRRPLRTAGFCGGFTTM